MTETEVRVVDVDAEIGETEREPLGEGEVGVVLARGKQIMKVREPQESEYLYQKRFH